MADKNKDKPSFKDTLNLPKTDFSIRANAKENEPKILKRWEQDNIYKKTFDVNNGKEKYILHDGPPYSNGNIHLGHAYNKLAKDFVCKVQRMHGKHVPVTPGWDCHGLPIELAVDRENPGMPQNQLKKKCREYAQKWVDIQREQFKALGVFMDWENPYLTMAPDYEAKILRAFAEFVEKGYIERKNKTVPWCPSCHTVLASAEIEHQERKDPSIYVFFPLGQQAKEKAFPLLKDKGVNMLVWTTTPWTLPLNRAVFLKPKTTYVVLEHEDKYFVVGKALADSVCSAKEIEKKIIAEISSDDIAGIKVNHPFVEGLRVPVLTDGFVGLDEGTACVHSAPGCGPEDYDVGIKNGLEIFSPLSPDGKYTVGIAPKELEDMSVVGGNVWAIRKLAERGMMFHKTSMRHPYPHCWRCHGPLIFRATKQWFCDLSKGDLREKALLAADEIDFIPEKARTTLKAAIGTRLEWCLSRQRVWGVPIPAAICNGCDYAYVNADFVRKVSNKVEKSGIEYWDDADLSEFLPKNYACPECGKQDFRKEKDILDVWFESGVSHYCVLKDNPKLGFPADMYIEARDQNRGWFQSSLLTSLVLENRSCVKEIWCHGYTVDKDGRKMSKSLGNVVVPKEIIDKTSTDVLRLWASSIEQGSDLGFSDQLLGNVSEVYRKIRNTCRFLLSNLYDFEKEKDEIVVNNLSAIDQYALMRLADVNEEIKEHYLKSDFTRVFHAFADYCTVELSSFYLDIVKDRLYVEKADEKKRRSTQTVCWYILDTLTRLMAPVLSFTAEQISDHYQQGKKESIHLQEFADLEWVLKSVSEGFTLYRTVMKTFEMGAGQIKENLELQNFIIKKFDQWEAIKQLRSALLKSIEGQRQKGIIKHPLEAKLKLYIDKECEIKNTIDSFFVDLERHSQLPKEFLKELMIVSDVEVLDAKDNLLESDVSGVFVSVEVAGGIKCPRCWQWSHAGDKDGLCLRCQPIVESFDRKV
ncbi:isoleucine--tRNA ligase [bacterium]|jgi:isoleucyl-tRNA synthetase|nr:isoleucine--tRNA ligase [bacterium]